MTAHTLFIVFFGRDKNSKVGNSRTAITNQYLCLRGPGSSVGTATGWTVRGPKPGGRRDFPYLSRPALGPTQPPVQWVPCLSRGKERPERDADPSPPSSAVVMKG